MRARPALYCHMTERGPARAPDAVRRRMFDARRQSRSGALCARARAAPRRRGRGGAAAAAAALKTWKSVAKGAHGRPPW